MYATSSSIQYINVPLILTMWCGVLSQPVGCAPPPPQCDADSLSNVGNREIGVAPYLWGYLVKGVEHMEINNVILIRIC